MSPDHSTSDPSLVRVKEEVEQELAAYEKARLRFGMRIMTGWLVVLVVAGTLIFTMGGGPWPPFVNIVTSLLTGLIALVAARWRRRHARQLRVRLEELPPEMRAEVLAGLRDEKKPNRMEFVAALEKELATRPRELAAADALEGRGSELTAGENSGTRAPGLAATTTIKVD